MWLFRPVYWHRLIVRQFGYWHAKDQQRVERYLVIQFYYLQHPSRFLLAMIVQSRRKGKVQLSLFSENVSTYECPSSGVING